MLVVLKDKSWRNSFEILHIGVAVYWIIVAEISLERGLSFLMHRPILERMLYLRHGLTRIYAPFMLV